MRDIRADIKERLDAVASSRERLAEQLRELEVDEAALRSFLEAENARWHNKEPELFRVGKRLEPRPLDETVSPVTKFLLDTLGDGTPWSLTRLKDHASNKGVVFGGDSPGRVLHGGLLGLKKRGVVAMIESGIWRLITENAPPVETDGA